jgi:hypothetical protein
MSMFRREDVRRLRNSQVGREMPQYSLPNGLLRKQILIELCDTRQRDVHFMLVV